MSPVGVSNLFICPFSLSYRLSSFCSYCVHDDVPHNFHKPKSHQDGKTDEEQHKHGLNLHSDTISIPESVNMDLGIFPKSAALSKLTSVGQLDLIMMLAQNTVHP